MLVQELRFIHKAVKNMVSLDFMELIREELKKSTADLFIYLMPMEANMEFGGIRRIPIRFINGKLVTPVIKVEITHWH